MNCVIGGLVRFIIFIFELESDYMGYILVHHP
jgi:hypothetical protein